MSFSFPLSHYSSSFLRSDSLFQLIAWLLPPLSLLVKFQHSRQSHWLFLASTCVHSPAVSHPAQAIVVALYKIAYRWLSQWGGAMTHNERRIIAWAPAIVVADLITAGVRLPYLLTQSSRLTYCLVTC